MARYKFVVFSDAVKGHEEEYEDWYVRQHIPAVLAIPGFVTGKQHKLAALETGLPQVGAAYMAVYDIETDDLQSVFAEMGARRELPGMTPPATMDRASVRSTLAEVID